MNEYYNYNEIDQTNANYRVIYGERSNGKTYGYKVYHGFNNWYDSSAQFMYVRRTVEEIKPSKMGVFFDDAYDYINEKCQKRYPQYSQFYVSAFKGKFDLYGITEKGEKELIDTIGFYVALSQAHHYKSVPFPRVTTLCFDEFLASLSTGGEIKDEFSRLLNLISTVRRRREKFIVYMLGNTVNRNSTILHEMGIDIRDIAQGELKVFQYTDGDVVNTVAVEYTKHFEVSDKSDSFNVFGNQKEMMIRNGAWETENYNTFKNSKYYDEQIVVAFKLVHNSIALYLYIPHHCRYIYVSSKRLPCDVDYITITTHETHLNRKTYNFNYNIPIVIKAKELMLSFLQNGFIYFDNNLTGDDYITFLRAISIYY